MAKKVNAGDQLTAGQKAKKAADDKAKKEDEQKAKKAPDDKLKKTIELKGHDRLKRAKEVFADHPKADKVYFTSDDTCFVVPQYAQMHAENLDNNQVDILTKEEV